jgi:hypothetical protein
MTDKKTTDDYRKLDFVVVKRTNRTGDLIIYEIEAGGQKPIYTLSRKEADARFDELAELIKKAIAAAKSDFHDVRQGHQESEPTNATS